MSARAFVNSISLLAVAALGYAGSPAAITVEAQSRPVSRIRFQEMDRNNDGVISRQEWNGSARSFEVHDWNNDGRLSGEEVRVGAQRNTNWETADHVPNRWERNLSWTRNSSRNPLRCNLKSASRFAEPCARRSIPRCGSVARALRSGFRAV